MISYAAVKLDISDNKELRASHLRLQDEQERLKTILDKTPVGVVITGADSRIRWANNFILRITEMDSLDGENYQHLFNDAGVTLRSLSEQKKIVCGDHLLQTCKGKKFPVFQCAQPINWCDEDVVLTTFVDLSERKKLENELAQKHKLESVGYLATGIAHEINTPIQFIGHNLQFLHDAVNNFLSYMQLHEKLTEQATAGQVEPTLLTEIATARDSLEIDFFAADVDGAINDSIDGVSRVAEIVKNMKEFSHQHPGVKTATDINRLVQNTTSVTRNEWKYTANLVIDLQPDLPQVPGLANDLNQVMLNLIVNARDAIAERKVSEPQHVGQIKIKTRFTENSVEIQVQDNGIGIVEENHNKVFDHFFSTKAVGKGTGQGLSIARNIIIDKHQGELTMESEAGVGTVFTIRLPLQ
jgi:signal transduction histidine kinase